MCFEFVYQRLYTNESVCSRFEVASENNTSQILKRMVGLVEMNSHRETPAVVSDALFMIIQSEVLPFYLETTIAILVTLSIYSCVTNVTLEITSWRHQTNYD